MRGQPCRALARVWTAAVWLLGAAAALPAAENYPVKPVRMLVGFPPGGANDLVARAIASRLAPRLGQPVVVENRAGAGGNIATLQAARAAPDGYTVLLGSVSSLAMGPALYREVGYDPLKDLAPVTQAVGVASVLTVHPSVPARSLEEFVALAKKQPGRLNAGSPGAGSIAHLSLELFQRTAGIELVHVPYKGGGPAVVDAIAGQIESLVSLISTAAPPVKAGRLRALAVSSARRSPALPQVPTIAEAGYRGYEASGWLGVLAPARTPEPIVRRLHREVVAVLNQPEVREQLEALGFEITPSDPASFRAYLQAEHAKWGRVIREAGIRAD